jgi:transcriptional activator of cad operon
VDDFYVDDWLVRPAQCRLSKGGETIQVRARVMDLLTYFVARPGEVITKEQLLDGIWGTREISESALTRTVTELRHALHDDAATPRFLETIPKRGYRLIARVAPAGTAAEPEQVPRGMARHQRLTVTAVCVLMTIVAGGLWAVSRQPAAADASSPSNPDAYDAYLRGLWHLRRGVTPNPHLSVRVQSRQTAVQELQRAVTLDPNFALARARLASAYTQRFFYDAADRALEEKAFVEIKKALALDPGLAEAYLARAQLTWNARNGFPHEEAIIDLRRAVSINPN